MTRLFLGLVLSLAFIAPNAAFAARSDWVAVDQGKMRLLLADTGEGGINAGIDVVIEPGWHTYWRNPGEAGVPPAFDFDGSANVAHVDVLYPAPERYDDGASVSLVYRDEVVFPLAVEPVDPGKPIMLKVDISLGVCAEVCIPTRASASATLAPDAPHDALSDALIKRFAARLPKAAEPGRFAIQSVAAADDALLIDVVMPDSSYSDLFANPPQGWYIGQPAFVSRDGDVSRYRLSLAGKPKDEAVSGRIFQFVAVAGGEAIEQKVEIK